MRSLTWIVRTAFKLVLASVLLVLMSRFDVTNSQDNETKTDGRRQCVLQWSGMAVARLQEVKYNMREIINFKRKKKTGCKRKENESNPKTWTRKQTQEYWKKSHPGQTGERAYKLNVTNEYTVTASDPTCSPPGLHNEHTEAVNRLQKYNMQTLANE